MRPPDQLSGARRVIVDDEADRALIERYRKGDREAFTELVVRYQRPIYNAAFWILRRAEDASDIAQVVFLRVAERADDYDPQYRFFSWIYRIAVNESLNLLRRNGNEDPLEEDSDIPEPDSKDPEARLNEAERAARVRQALMTMSTTDRTVLTLRHFSECSYQEIADILEVDEATVKSRLYEARQRLRRLLDDLK
ncbi:MAG: sigma-70 family RNA polymerase sigma factor [Proteobacteria bacterium]|jgi:RNA polymerase sigma-70 factor (ECF subfamily)|nr:sigma-70 family RNA polymerase sigma factor [Pseudomonadota bacterium]